MTIPRGYLSKAVNQIAKRVTCSKSLEGVSATKVCNGVAIKPSQRGLFSTPISPSDRANLEEELKRAAERWNHSAY